MTNCKARRYSDQMLCECGLAWDINDPEPPQCSIEIPTVEPTDIDEMPTGFYKLTNGNFVKMEVYRSDLTNPIKRLSYEFDKNGVPVRQKMTDKYGKRWVRLWDINAAFWEFWQQESNG